MNMCMSINLLEQQQRCKKISTLVDSCSIINLGLAGEQLGDLPKMGFQVVLIPEIIHEQKLLSHSIARQMEEGFEVHNPLRILTGAKIIDSRRPEVTEERKRIYSEIGCALDSTHKKHSLEDPDMSFLAVARLYNVELLVSDDKRLLRAAQMIGIRARKINSSEFRKLIIQRRKLMRELEEREDQAEKQPEPLIKCLVCGKEVRGLNAHFVEAHGKAKKTEDIREHPIAKDVEQKRTKWLPSRVVSFTVCANVCSQSSKASDHEHVNRQVTVAISSNANSQSDEIIIAKSEGGEGSKIVSTIHSREGI